MAKFLDTTGVSYHLQQLINRANDKLILLSPYLKLNERVKQALLDREVFKTNIRIVYGKSELQPEEAEWMRKVKSIRLSFCKNLHAKCYLSESEAIVTSMNLYEFSQVNNVEMGIYISKAEDPVLYQEIVEEVGRIVRMSEDVQISIERVKLKEAPVVVSSPGLVKAKAEQAIASESSGHCIRCGDTIRLNPMYPYCRECYDDWSGDDEEPEEYCHICGNEHSSSKVKPSCYPCFKANRNKLEWPAA
ncbi:phospholipase D family protein [Archangium gephyra]|uniref:phospholipase D family protein n=1 Tax=Archangium gephyra TaxID=48 RepID=UPI003B819497